MFDYIEVLYTCANATVCYGCKFCSECCNVYLNGFGFSHRDIDEMFTIHYAEGEI